MQGSSNDRITREIRQRTDVVALVGEYVTLRKAGRNYSGLCPFHQEKTPSFTVSSEKQIFHCFGCGANGDVFTFLMKMENLTFPEAVRQLARRTGTVIPERSSSRTDRERLTLNENIIRVNGLAADYFSLSLTSQSGLKAREYLYGRGISQRTIEEFRIGFAPEGWQGLLDFLSRKGVSPDIAEQAGLAVPRSGEGQKGHYDRFRGRIIIPIEDTDGGIVAFGGRVMGPGEPKYLNSPESPVYTKGNTLFGLFRTREAIRTAGFALLVEGYFDLISLWAAGIKNVVATLGTALTRSQVDLLTRYTKRVAAVFDPDAAGRKALARSLDLFLAGNVHAMAVILPEGYDPDSFVRTQGRIPMEQLLADARPMADYYIEEILGGSTSLQEGRDKLRDAVAFVKKIEDVVERNLFIKKVAEKLNVDQDLLKKEVGKAFAPPSSSKSHSAGSPLLADTGQDRIELGLVHMLFENPELIPLFRKSGILDFFKSPGLRDAGELLISYSEKEGEKNLNVISALDNLENEGIKKALYGLLVSDNPYRGDEGERLFFDMARQIKHRWYKEQHRILKEKISRAERAGNRELCQSLLGEIGRLMQEENKAAFGR